MKAIEKIFGTHSERELKRIYPLIDKIESYRPAMQELTDEQLKDKTKEFKKRLADGETLDDLLPEAYATVREAAKRVLGMEHYRVQLIGGIILHQGRIAEMKTGEGKTLVSTLPAYLNALEGKGVHVVTVNEYLAKRDAEWMGQVHEFLGLTVGVVFNGMDTKERQDAYNCDITYITNNELGFDYLRDNMVIYKEQLVQRGLHFAIIDEVDSVLIDEARTPLIISGQSGKSTSIYEACDILARQMKRGEDQKEYTKMDAIMGVEIEEDGDFVVNEKDKVVNLTLEGVKKVEQFFHIDNLADPDNLEIQHNIILALRAHNLMFRDQDYVVKDDQVLIVDEFTGRIMPGRRYSDGLHQAIEAKEHVKVKRESKTLANITFQNFFNKYDKKAGMTGTALTEEKEFRDIYGMDVIEIPTNRPVIRVDKEDAVYKTKKEKFHAVVDEVEEAYKKGQPVLVGTINIDTSELVSSMLNKRGIPHKVLNAKFHELEAEIVAQAGVHGAVTIATNMAGRGTDIKLDDEAKEAGGLKIIGTERHESGTALTEEKEFRDIYGMDVIEIPTNRPVIRVDKEDAVYKTKKEKFHAVVDEVEEAYKKGQPVLVGTINIDTSELVSSMLNKRGIPHKVLNAKFHELEAEIVAQAGVHGAVTIATNMAGRGTDIKLDDEAKEAGGLKIIGTERHESRRIDNQLRGRSGRQGDPGESQFFISLEDDLMRLFGSEKLLGMFNALGVPEGEQIQHKMLTSAIEKAQKKIEGNNFGIRKNLLEYDQVMNDQREIIYAERLRVLNGESMRDVIYKMITDRVENTVDTCISPDLPAEEWDINELNQLLIPIIPLQQVTPEQAKEYKDQKKLKHALKEQAVKLYEEKEAEFPEPEAVRELERVILLKVIDRKWMDHIDDMDQLRQGIGLQAYGQRDPLVEYKMSGYDMFEEMINSIQEDTVRLLFHVRVEQKVEREQVAKVTGTNKDETAQGVPKKRAAAKVYPNDPCPCGSGKKYKQCCGRKA